MHTKAIIHSHWVGFLCLAPFLVTLLIHRLLGLSDALMIQTPSFSSSESGHSSFTRSLSRDETESGSLPSSWRWQFTGVRS